MQTKQGWTEGFNPLTLGFVLTVIITSLAYLTVANEWATGNGLITTVMLLSGAGAIVQLVLFMHLGDEASPHWNLISFLFLVIILIVLIGGSMWIMGNLGYNVMPDIGDNTL